MSSNLDTEISLTQLSPLELNTLNNVRHETLVATAGAATVSATTVLLPVATQLDQSGILSWTTFAALGVGVATTAFGTIRAEQIAKDPRYIDSKLDSNQIEFSLVFTKNLNREMIALSLVSLLSFYFAKNGLMNRLVDIPTIVSATAYTAATAAIFVEWFRGKTPILPTIWAANQKIHFAQKFRKPRYQRAAIKNRQKYLNKSN